MSDGNHWISLRFAFQTWHLTCQGSSRKYWSNCWRKKHLAALPEGTSCPQWFQNSRIDCTIAYTVSKKEKDIDFPNNPKVNVDMWITYNRSLYSFVIFVSCIAISSAVRRPRTPSHPDPRSPGRANWPVANDNHAAFWGKMRWVHCSHDGIYWSFGPRVLSLRSGDMIKPKQAANQLWHSPSNKHVPQEILQESWIQETDFKKICCQWRRSTVPKDVIMTLWESCNFCSQIRFPAESTRTVSCHREPFSHAAMAEL